MAQEAGLAPFGLFEITPLAIILVGYGAVYLWLFGGWLLPSRNSMSDFLRDKTDMRYLTEVIIPEDSGLIGELAVDVDSFKRDNGRVIDVRAGRRVPCVKTCVKWFCKSAIAWWLKIGGDRIIGLKRQQRCASG